MTYTDFTKYSHAQLRKMAEALNPGEVMAAADPWRRAADTLKAIRTTLTRASTDAADHWDGATSDAFHTRMLHLAESINNAASYANDAANTLKNMSEAIAKAKRDMPEEPGTWDKVTDTVGDFFSGDDDHIPVADQKKAEAATVMQTLAMHYRIATPALKSPQSLPPAGKTFRNDDRDVPSTGAPDGSSAAVGAMMAGAIAGSDGVAPATTGGSVPQARRSAGQSAVVSPGATRPAAPSDPGIKGGTAQPVQKPLPSAVPAGTSTANGTGTSAGTPFGPGGTGPGTGIDGARTGTSPGTGTPAPSNAVATPPSGGGGVPNGPQGQVVGPPNRAAAGETGRGPGAKGVIVGEREVIGQAPRAGRAAGSGEVMAGRFGSGVRARPEGGSGSGLPGRAGDVVGGGGRPGGRESGRQAFTEGGSGLGARSRARAELGSGGSGVMGPVMGVGGGRRGGKDREKGGKRPDYLVEDAETWAPDKPSNPNVVE
ncbi:hypothetical protein [Kitasatospora sp. NPDC097643]|uniref:WXG100 family type VII secretion target n=1 Tax=Kitasatospora sp. NPDC097643 TaxID=3157230 RepID=UPI0033219388